MCSVPCQNYALISVVGPESPQKHDSFGLKIYGTFPTKDDAARHAKDLQKLDGSFDIYVVDLYQWLLIPPDRNKIDDVHYQEEKLEEIMSKYRESQRSAAALFEKRKKEMSAKPLEGVDTPFIESGDENSKFYSKPDVPPQAHPADILEDYKFQFPDKTMDELIEMVNERVASDEKKRKDALFEEAKSKEASTSEDAKGKEVASIE
jgi:hypothetical protein